MLSPDEAAFIDRIREDHADDLPRLIYADWLDERGDAPRADFIRVQCALAKLSHDDPAADKLHKYETQLTDAHAADWNRDIEPLVEGFSYRRGMLEAVAVKPAQFARLGEKVFAKYPIRRLRFLESAPEAYKVFQSPLMRFAAELDFSGYPMDAVKCAAIARARHLRTLEMLDLGYTGIASDALTMLIQSPAAARLKTLRLNGNHPLSADSLRAVFKSQSLTALETLDLSDNQLTVRNLDPVLDAFAALPKLKYVPLRGNRLWVGLQEFLNSPFFNHLLTHDHTLDLTANEIESGGVRYLSDLPSLAKVRSLTLDHNPIRDAGLSALTHSAHATALTRLSVVRCGLSEESVRELANSSLMAQLVDLDLRENLITQESVERLLEMSRRKLSAGTLTVRADPVLTSARSATELFSIAMRRARN